MSAKSLLLEFKVLLITFLYLLVLPIVYILCLPLLFYRQVVQFSAVLFRPDLDRILSPQNHLLCYDDFYGNTKFNIITFLTLEGGSSLKSVRANLERAMVYKKNLKNGGLMHPELQQGISFFGGYPFWRWDRNFCIENHVYECQLGSDSRSGVTQEDLQDFISMLMSKSWKRDQALWDCYVVNNYIGTEKEEKANSSVLIFRINHCLGDGYSILSLLKSTLTGNTGATVRIPKRKVSFFQKMVLPLKMVRDHVRAKMLLEVAGPNQWKRPLTEIKKGFYTVWSRPIPMEKVKRFKNGFGVSFQSVVYTITGGCVRRLMESAGQAVPQDMIVFIPLPVALHPGGMTNQTVPLFTKLPIRELSQHKRAQAISRKLDESSRSAAPLFVWSILSFLGSLPFDGLKLIINHAATVGITSFPSFQGDVQFNEQSMLTNGFAVGTGRGTAGAVVSVLTFNGNIIFTITIDKGVFPYESLVREWGDLVQAEFQELEKATNDDGLIGSLESVNVI